MVTWLEKAGHGSGCQYLKQNIMFKKGTQRIPKIAEETSYQMLLKMSVFDDSLRSHVTTNLRVRTTPEGRDTLDVAGQSDAMFFGRPVQKMTTDTLDGMSQPWMGQSVRLEESYSEGLYSEGLCF